MRLKTLSIKIISTLFAILLINGCNNVPIEEIQFNKFKKLYFSIRYTHYHVDYVGVKEGYHYLKEISIGETGSYPKLQKIYKIPEDMVPNVFFQTPQKEIIKIPDISEMGQMTEQEFAEKFPEIEITDKQKEYFKKDA